MTTTLTDKIWRTFFIEEIFDILPGKRLTKAEMISGDTPFIGASDSNNGVTNFVGNDNESADENFLSVSYNGSVCQCFYHPYHCLCSDDVKRFHLKNRDGNKYIYLFMASAIRKQKDKYNYGYKFNESRMRRQKILLPVDESGQPDFNFMENYMRKIEEEQLQKYRDFITLLSPPYESLTPLNEKIWRPFLISNLFRLEVGKCSQANQLKKSDKGIPYIGATNRNNGVLDFVEPVEKLISRGNAIAFVCDGEGSMGYSFYKAEDCIATTNIIFGYANFLNRYVGMFITTVADKVRGKYSYNYKRRLLRLEKEKLMLPVDESAQPDFAYMENYIRNIMAGQYRKYLEYIGGK